MGLCPIPATATTICRYIAYLGRTCAFSTVQQYLNIIRIMHLDMGLENPLHDNWSIKSLLKGLKRGKSAESRAKLPIHPEDLIRIHGLLNLKSAEDCSFWAAILTCFFGLLRVSNVSCGTGKCPLRRDISITSEGIIINVTATKTIQYSERALQVPLPYINSHVLCPTSAILVMLSKGGPVASHKPLFAYYSGGLLKYPTAQKIRLRLHALLSQLGYPGSRYGTHSLRRGGATWLLLSGVPLPIIKILGDWKSDCVMRYIKPRASSHLDILNKVCANRL